MTMRSSPDESPNRECRCGEPAVIYDAEGRPLCDDCFAIEVIHA